MRWGNYPTTIYKNNNKRDVLMYVPVLCFLLFFSLALPVSAETLRLLNWEDYLSPDVEQRWQQSGHQIEPVFFDSDEKRDAILINSDEHSIDIAVVDEIVASRFGREGRLIKVDEQNVPSLAYVDAFWRARCGDYAVPYLWGTLGIAYRSDIIKQPPDSWDALLQPADSLKGHIGMLNDYTDMLAPVIFKHGYSLNTENETELRQVFATLKELTDNILTFEYPITFLDSDKRADQLHMAVVYGGDQYSMNDSVGQEGLWKYTVPKEGTVLWVDCLAITSNSENKELALAFLDFLNKPEIAAINAEDLYYATPNREAEKLLPEIFRNNPEVFPNQAILDRSQLYKELSNKNIELRLRITNAIVNIHESGKTR